MYSRRDYEAYGLVTISHNNLGILCEYQSDRGLFFYFIVLEDKLQVTVDSSDHLPVLRNTDHESHTGPNRLYLIVNFSGKLILPSLSTFHSICTYVNSWIVTLFKDNNFLWGWWYNYDHLVKLRFLWVLRQLWIQNSWYWISHYGRS